jgi:hypothetical protein
MTDTPPEITTKVRELLSAHPGAERLMMWSQVFEAARAMVLASFPLVSLRSQQNGGCASGSTAARSTPRRLFKAS